MSKVYHIGKFSFSLVDLNVIVAIIIVLLAGIGFPKHASTKALLSKEGLTMIETSRSGLMSCGYGFYLWRTDFKAVDRRRIKIEGVVCETVISGPEIRVRSYIVKMGGSDGS